MTQFDGGDDADVADTFIDVLTVNGNSGSTTGGTLLQDADFSNNTADMLVIGGNSTGAAAIDIQVSDASVGLANGGSVQLVDVGGPISDATAFTINSGPVASGIWNYDLEQTGLNWFLTGSPNSTASVYEAMSSNLLQFANMPSFSQRISHRANSPQTRERSKFGAGNGSHVWARISGSGADTLPALSTTGITGQDHRSWGLEVGIDLPTENGLTYGVSVHTGNVGTSILSPLGTGSISSTGYGLGLSATWIGDGGVYVDAQARYTAISTDANSSTGGQILSGHKSHSYSMSDKANLYGEVSYRSAIGGSGSNGFSATAGISVKW